MMAEVKLPRRPGAFYVRWSVLVNWMREWGYGEYTVRRMVAEGKIKKHFLHGSKQAMYVPAEVEKDVFYRS